MKYTRRLAQWSWSITLLLALVCVQPAFAHVPGDFTEKLDENDDVATEKTPEPALYRLLRNSDLVFQGQVKQVEYRKSQDGTPYAFVTYKLQKIIRGRAKRRVTLRFVGGPKGDGSFLMAQSVPNFFKGDKDILFVRKNTTAQCPLVGCNDGRFRVVKERVYSAIGKPLVGINKEGSLTIRGEALPQLQIVRFPAPTFRELLKREEIQQQLEAIKKKGRKVDLAVLEKEYNTRAKPTINFTWEAASDLASNDSGALLDWSRRAKPSQQRRITPKKEMGLPAAYVIRTLVKINATLPGPLRVFENATERNFVVKTPVPVTLDPDVLLKAPESTEPDEEQAWQDNSQNPVLD